MQEEPLAMMTFALDDSPAAQPRLDISFAGLSERREQKASSKKSALY